MKPTARPPAAPAAAHPPADDGETYTIDELARVAGATVRNVRAYLERGLLPPAGRRKRAAIYSDIHLARLRVIADLLSRGYTLASIGELLEAWEKGWELTQVIHVETVLASPWEHEEPLRVPRAELDVLFGTPVTRAQVAMLAALGWLVPEDDLLRVPHPRILRAASNIVRGGVPLSVLLAHANALREQMALVAETMSTIVVEGIIVPHAKSGLPSAEDMPRLTEAVRAMRPLAEPLVSAELVRALEQVATRYLGDRLIAALAPSLAASPAKSPVSGAARTRANAKAKTKAKDPVPKK